MYSKICKRESNFKKRTTWATFKLFLDKKYTIVLSIYIITKSIVESFIITKPSVCNNVKKESLKYYCKVRSTYRNRNQDSTIMV